MMKLQTIDENLMYSVLSTPTFTGKEWLMVECIAEHIQMKGYEGGIDDKGNVYLCKGKLSAVAGTDYLHLLSLLLFAQS